MLKFTYSLFVFIKSITARSELMLERFSSIRSCFIKIKNSWGMYPSPLKSSLGKSKTKLEMLAKLEI